MLRLLALVLALAAALPAAAAPLTLERVVLVQRHGVRPPTVGNDQLAKYAAQPWPAWPVPPGELTPHGALVVRQIGATLRADYRRLGLLPTRGCPGAGAVSVWADGTDQRTRRSGEITAEALAPGCGVRAAWAPPDPRDPIFSGAASPACQTDLAQARNSILSRAGPTGLSTPATDRALARLQSILAPMACSGGPGTCFRGDHAVVAGGYAGARVTGPIAETSSLVEDLLLEYVEGMPAKDVGWGRAASPAAIAAVMPLHERQFELTVRNPYLAGRRGALMARLIVAALAGEANPTGQGPQAGPATRLLALSGHDSNLAYMGAVFGLDWALPGQPEATAPGTTLAFEVWRDPASGARYVKPVAYYDTLTQMRALTPARAQRLPLTFNGCASGPNGSCPLPRLRQRMEAIVPPRCGLP